MAYLKNKEVLAHFVADRVRHLKPGSALTMTIIQGQFEDYSVSSAIDGLSVDTVETKEQTSSKQPTNTSPEIIQGG